MDLLKTQYVFNCNKADVIKQGVLTPCRNKKNSLLLKLCFIRYSFFISLLKKIIVKGITKNKLGGI